MTEENNIYTGPENETIEMTETATPADTAELAAQAETAETAAPAAQAETLTDSAGPADAAGDTGEYIDITSIDPLAHEQEVNRTREFTDEPRVLSPWAAAEAGADPYSSSRRNRWEYTPYTASTQASSPDQSENAESGERLVSGEEVYRRLGEEPGDPDRRRKPGYVTRKAFVIGMILCMMATSGLTIGGLGLAGVLDKPVATDAEGKIVSATNYTLAEATGNEKSIEEIVAMNENAVVEIVTESVVTDSWLQSYVTQGAGSGVIVDSRGYIVTNNHVISGARSITVTLKSGKQFSARVVGADANNDVAVIKIEGSGFIAATYGNSGDLSVGDLAVAIGNPLGQLGGTVTTGIISALDRELTIDGKVLTLLQTDASINPGNSGGGLFDGEGNMIGLVVAKSGGSNVEGLGFAIPINIVAPLVKDMIENDNPEGRALIGINVINIESDEQAKTYGFDSTGVFITEVNSPEARKAGLEAGDRITVVGNQKISDYDALTTALSRYAP